MADKADLLKRVREEEDYIRCPKFGNSIQKLLNKNSNGIDENSKIAKFLLISEEEVDKLYNEAVAFLRQEMKDED